MKKTFGYIIVLVGFLMVTFFGLGPVLFADGSQGERMGTFAVVLAIYSVLIVFFRYIKSMK